jgi:hypothetical protein
MWLDPRMESGDPDEWVSCPLQVGDKTVPVRQGEEIGDGKPASRHQLRAAATRIYVAAGQAGTRAVDDRSREGVEQAFQCGNEFDKHVPLVFRPLVCGRPEWPEHAKQDPSYVAQADSPAVHA